MGNRTSKNKTSSDGSKKAPVKLRQKKNGANTSTTSRDKKVISCPDLSGAVPYKFNDEDAGGDPSQIDVKIYRSYSNVAEAGEKGINTLSGSGPQPDIRVYRRSTGNLRHSADPGDKSQTLPRSFGRTRSAITSLQQQNSEQKQSSGQSNGTLPRDRRSDGGEGVVRRRSTAGSGYNLGGTKGSRRTLSTASMNSIGYKVNPEDFPDTNTIKRRLTMFETSFVRSVVEVFSSELSDEALLSLLSIAIRPDRANQQVALLQYLQTTEIPANLNEAGGNSLRLDYILTIPQMLFKEVFRIRQENVGDIKTWVAIGRHIMSCQAMEAANELSRVFEYQLSLMPEGLPVELLCRHSAQCVLEFLKKNSKHLDRNTIVQGVIKGSLRVPDVCPKFSVILGERELKWNLFEILKKPGLRKEMFLLGVPEEEIDSEQSPWKFYTSSKSDPMLYGYRGLVVDWDFASSTYQLNGEDEASFPDEVDWRPDDFHRDYNLHRRLVGLTVMRNFCDAAAASNKWKELTIGDYVKHIQGKPYSRDRVQPVYRPIGDGDGLRDQLPLETVNLGNADTLRLRKGKKKPDATVQPEEVSSRPKRISGLKDGVVMVAVPAEKRTPTRSSEASPIVRINAKLSPGSTISRESRDSNPMRPKSRLSGTGSPQSVGSRLSEINDAVASSSLDDSAVSKETEQETSKLPPSNRIGATAQSEDTSDADQVVSDVATGTTDNDSFENEEEDDFVETALKPSQVISGVSRRSTITSDV